jgi:hypothetical protein
MLISVDFYVLLPHFIQLRLWDFHVDIHGILVFQKQDSTVWRGMIFTLSFHDALMRSF